jgi:GT2 family glycosyltransferase
MNIYCIVVTYNGAKWVDKCFGSLVNSTIPLKILAIDNGSTDDTLDLLRENFASVEVIKTGKNLGFGKANNIGLRIALNDNADFVFLLNQDAWVSPDTIAGLIKHSKSNKEYGILSPVHLSGAGTCLDYRFSLCCNEKDCPGFLSDVFLKTPKDIYTINFVNAALWLISKDCLLKVGLFDPIFPHYGEDDDYINRVKGHGFKVGISPLFVGYHNREDRPFSEKRDKVLRYLGYLSILKDINKSFVAANILVLSVWMKNIIRFAIKLKWMLVCSEIKSFIRLLFSYYEIVKKRKISKRHGAFLLMK